jgi:hypothetical protein
MVIAARGLTSGGLRGSVLGVRHRMLTRVGNLILASLALMVSLMGEAGCHSAVSSLPPHPHGPITIREVVMDSIVIFWFAGALGLFSRRRLAWAGSLLGTGASACFFATSLVTVIGLCIFPSAEQARDWDFGGRIFSLIFGGGMFSALLAVSLGLFVGLIRMRKELR